MNKIIILILLIVTLSFANSYDKALKAFEKKEYKQSFKLFKQAQKEGNDNALYSLAYMFYYGYGTKQDYQQALLWFLKASEHGSTSAYGYLGYMYGHGQGIKENNKKAVYYYKLGVKYNDADSMCDLSEYYINGWGVQKNYFKALELVKKGYQLKGSYCKKVWNKYDLASKKERNQLNYNTEKKLCMQNFNINPNKAIEHCEYAVQLQPNDNKSRYFLAFAYFRIGQLKEALKEYNYLENQLLDNFTLIAIYAQKGNVLAELQKNNEALKYYNKALSLSNKKSIKMYNPTIYNGIGMVKEQQGNYNEALKYLNKSLLLTNNKQLKMSITNNIGICYLNEIQYVDAINMFKLSVALCDEIHDYIQKDVINSNLAIAYLFNNNFKEAKKLSIESVNGATKTNNLSALLNSYLVYSAVLEKEGQKEESDKYFKKANIIANQIGISLKNKETQMNLSPLNILKNMFKKLK